MKINFKCLSIIFSLLLLCSFYSYAQDSQDNPYQSLMDEILLNFPSVSGKVITSHNNKGVINKGERDKLKVGLRINIYREDSSFIHPVTKEFLGKIEKQLALAEITSVKETEAEIKLLTKVEDNINDSLFKIPRSKIKALFFQGDINWYLADSYYQMLKDSGRFELIDSTMETLDMSKLSEEASKKEVDLVIIIDSDKKTDVTSIRQKLYWGKDFKAISDKTIILKPGYVQSLMTKALPLITSDSNILLTYQVPNTIKKIALADLNGDGSPDIILATENSFSIYQPSTDLKLLWDFSNFTSDQLLWIDSIDIDMSKRDSLIVTAYKDGEVRTSVYKLIDNNLKELVSLRNVFMRRLGNSLIGQEYSRSQGFESKIYYYDYKDGKLVRGAAVIIPEKVNLYDFSPIESPDGKKGLIVWDDKGFLTLYSSSGIISWRSAEDFGGFTTKIKRESPIFMIDRGEWSVKDRLVQKGGGVLAPKRKPLFGMAKGLGYKESEIKVLWWNGLSVEQITLIDKLDGEILDYGLLNDRLLVLCKPLMGIKPLNVLKGSNPFLNTLYVISVKGFYN